METLLPRQTDILRIAARNGRVDVDGLAREFEVSQQTIRKDLNVLCDAGLLRRIHGGAMHPSGVTNYGYDARRSLAADAKRAIAERAAALIPDHSSIVINIGTTTEQLALALRRHTGLLVVTNNINVANILREAPAVEVVIAGGLVRPSDGGIVGEAAVDFIRQFKVDFAVIGASGIEADGTVLDYDYREVRVAQEMVRNARQTILVADSTKFSRTAPVKIVHLEDIDILVTDSAPPAAIAEICDSRDVRLEIARGDSVHGRNADGLTDIGPRE